MQKLGKIILILLLTTLLSSYVYAVFEPTLCWNFDVDASPIAENCEDTGTYVVNTILSDYDASCKIGGCRDYTDANSDQDDVNASTKISLSGNEISMGCWYKTDVVSASGNTELFCNADGTDVWLCLGQNELSVNYQLYNRFYAVAGVTGPNRNANPNWEHYIASFDGTSSYLYINGTRTDQATVSTTIEASLNAISFGDNGRSQYFDGLLDECFLYDGNISDAEALEVFQRTTSWGTAAGNSTPPAITLNTSLTNNINSSLNPYTFTIDAIGSLVNTTDVWNISVYYNGTLNQTHLNIANLNTTHFTINLTYGSEQVGHDINVSVAHGYDAATDSFLRTNIFLDSVIPTMTLGGAFTNNSIYYVGIDTLFNLNLSLTDSNLFFGNFSLFRINNATNYTLLNQTNLTNIQTTNVVLNISFNLNELLNGSYLIDGFVADAHTKNIVKPIQWFTSPDTIIIDTAIYITGNIKEELTEFYLSESGDRYKFKITWDVNALNHELTIKGDDALYYRPNSKYKGHFVLPSLLRWVDFENDNIKDIVVTDLGNNEFKLNIELYSISDEIEFESIGSLNTLNKQWLFNVSNGFTFYAKDSVANTTISNFTVELYNTTGTLIQNKTTTNANITFNISSGTYSGNVSANLYITNSSGSLVFTPNGFKTMYLVASNSLYLFIYDEQVNELITGRNVTLDIINYENTSSSYTTSTGSTFQSGFAAGNYEINYKADNYTARSYYTTITGSDTQSINLFLLNDTDTTHQYLDYDVVDESAAPLSNATLKMQRYFISDGIWQTVEMSISNDGGQGFIFAELYDVTYRFIVEYPQGTTKKISSLTKLDTRDLFFSISLLDVGLDNFYTSGKVATTLVYSNTTKVWTYSFNGASLSNVSSGQFLVTQIDPNLITTICNTTISSDSGGMTCNLTAYTSLDSTFLAQGFVTFTSDADRYLVEAASLKVKQEHLNYGFNGLYLSFIIVGTMAFIGLFSPQISIIMALFGLIITNVMGLVYLNPTWLISLIIVGIVYIFSMKR